jgi:probable phosphoglycerate mutase
VIARLRGLEKAVALFGHGHAFRVFVARWLGLSVSAGSHFLLDTATVSVVSCYQGIPAVKRWNVPVVDGPGGWRET